MPYDLSKRLVVGLASSALFDLTKSDQIFRTKGEAAYREYQREHQNDPLKIGAAFPFVKRLLHLNKLRPDSADDPLVEVMLLSRNDPDTGLRVMNSIEHHNLGITRAVFLQGKSPYRYIPAFNIELFLSANTQDVHQAVTAGYPAGHVLNSAITDEPDDPELRIAFDFDGVLVDDEAEAIFQKEKSVAAFREHEESHADIPHNPGLLKNFLQRLSEIQQLEMQKVAEEPAYAPMLKVSIVTARGAPAHKRVIRTMRAWDITVNEAFFLGGVGKEKVLETMRPHIFFDDQKLHLEPASKVLPAAVHIPFGITNEH